MYVWDDRERAVQEIQQHYATICAQYPVDRAQVVVGGFSRGGGLSSWLALSGAVESRGFIAVAPSLRGFEGLADLIDSGPAQRLRGYIVAGEQDTDFLNDAHKLAVLLQSRKIPCKLELHPDLGHDFPPEFERSLVKGLDFMCQ